MIDLAHHWLVAMRGGEKVLAEFSLLVPQSTIWTIVADDDQWDSWVHGHTVRTSLLQKSPLGTGIYKKLLPLFPLAVGRMKIPEDRRLLLTSDAAVMKGIRVPEHVPHVCYCHSPPRYLWDQQDTYLKQTSGLGLFGKWVFRAVTPYVRDFDRRAAQRVDHFIANSDFVSKRIKQCYDRDSVVIHPPVSVDDFRCDQPREDFYLVVSAMVPYKRVDLAVEAFTRMKKRLVVIGDGSERPHLERIAGPTVKILGAQPFSVLQEYYQNCRAFIFPGVEDFGITPLEAMASGAPVIALGEGGALETVVQEKTGVFFHEQSVDALVEAIEQFEHGPGFDPVECRRRAEKFSPNIFRDKMWRQLVQWYPFLEEHAQEWQIGPVWSPGLRKYSEVEAAEKMNS